MKIEVIGIMKLKDVPKGCLFICGETLALKSEYSNNNGQVDAYIVGSGEYFWGGTDNAKDQCEIIVTAIKIKKLCRY